LTLVLIFRVSIYDTLNYISNYGESVRADDCNIYVMR
jgi:hypothetical protein